MGTLSLAASLVLFEKNRLWVGTGFHLLPSFPHHLAQHDYTTQTVTHTVTLTSTFSSTLYYTDTHPTRNVVCPRVAWFKNRQHLMPSLRGTRSTHICKGTLNTKFKRDWPVGLGAMLGDGQKVKNDLSSFRDFTGKSGYCHVVGLRMYYKLTKFNQNR